MAQHASVIIVLGVPIYTTSIHVDFRARCIGDHVRGQISSYPSSTNCKY